MATEVKVHVTHFENPSNFYFRFEDSDRQTDQNKCNLKRIERELSLSVKDGILEECAKAVGSIVGYLHYKWLIWIRAKIVKKSSNGSLHVFLVDRGYFMEIYRDTKLIDLPESLQRPSEVVFEGSLAVQPCDQVLDHSTSKVINSPVRYWGQKAVKFLQQYNLKLENASLHWRFVLVRKAEDGVHYGDLFLMTPLETISMCERLINESLAIYKDGMQLNQLKGDTLGKRPLALQPSSNFKKIIQNCCPELLVQKANQSSRVTLAKMIPSGVDFGGYSNKQVPVMPKPPTNRKYQLTQRHRTDPRLPSVQPPLDLFMFGQNLQSDFKSIDSTTFRKEIKDCLKTNNHVMTKIQAHVWPQIHHGRSVIIVPASERTNSPMTFMPPVVNTIISNREAELGGTGPVAVVIAKSSTDVKDILRICLNLVPAINAVELGTNTKAVELINGCDLIVSTPLAFTHLVDGNKIDLFNKDRIRTLVFHGVDQLLGKFDSEINEIIRRCTYGHKNVDKNPQIIVTSSVWFKDIEKLTILVTSSRLVHCIENFIDAAVLSGIKIVIEIGLDFDAKFRSMCSDLNSGAYKTKRTAIIANDEVSFKYLLEKFSKTNIQVIPSDQHNFDVAKTTWLLQEVGKFSVLIMSDSVVKDMKMISVQNLIHFVIPKTWNTFTERFVTLMHNMYMCLEKKIEPNLITTKIFIDEENNIKEFVHLVKFMQSRKMEVPNAMVESVKTLEDQDEQIKCHDRVAVCDKVWMFGECIDYPCPLRHVFSALDASSDHLPSQTSIKFELVTVQSPSTYVIKILSRKEGQNWVSLKEKNLINEAVVSIELQKVCTNMENYKTVVLETGEKYVTLFEKKWRRCQVLDLEPNSPLLKVYLIDEGRDVHCKSANICAMPDQFKNIEPIVYKLFIMNLVPFHSESSWPLDTNKKIAEILKVFGDGYTLATNVMFAVQKTLISKSIEVEDAEFGAVKLHLINKLVKLCYCSKDEKAGQRLLKLFNDASLVPKQATAIEPEVHLPPIMIHASKSQNAPAENSAKERWKHLSWKSYYDVRIQHFKNPESFFVVLASEDNMTLREKLREIENSSAETPLREIAVGAVCLVNGPKLQRGKILKVEDDSVEVLLVDFGNIINCQAKDLYSVSTDLMSKISFQTVHCRIIGIRPKYNMNTWPPKQCEAIENLIRGYSRPLRMFIMKKNEKIDELNCIGTHSYEVILIDSHSGVHLDDLVVTKSFADRSGYEKPKDLEKFFDSGNVSEELENSSNDVNLLQRMLDSMMRNELSGTESADEGVEVQKEEVYAVREKAPIKKLEDEQKEKLQVPQSALKYLVKHPIITWQQNEVSVQLFISTIDCIDYGMKIGGTFLEVTVVYVNNRYEKATIDLYCAIEPEMCSHELRGLNIIARLVKKEPNIDWPRLTEGRQRSQFIQFSNENIKESTLPLNAVPAELMLSDAEYAHSEVESFELSEMEDNAFEYSIPL